MTISAFSHMTTAQINDVQSGACTLDVSAAVNASITDAFNSFLPETVDFPPGVYGIASPLIIKTGVTLQGHGQASTIVRVLPSHASVVMLQTLNFATLTGTGNPAGPYKWAVRNMSFDGNRANVTGTSAANLQFYGYDYVLDQVNSYNATGIGLYSEWSTDAAVPVLAGGDAMDAVLNNIKTFSNHGIGFQFRGPHDSAVNLLRTFNNDGIGASFEGDGVHYMAGGTMLSDFHAYANNSGGGLHINDGILGNTIESESNTGYGIQIDSSGYLTATGLTMFGNTGAGLSIIGEWSVLDNINSYDNGSDAINVSGIYNNLVNMRCWTNSGYGLNVGGNNNLFQTGRLHSNTHFTFNGGTGNQLLNLFS